MVKFPLNEIGNFVVISNPAIALVRHLERNVVESKGLIEQVDLRTRNNECRFLIKYDTGVRKYGSTEIRAR